MEWGSYCVQGNGEELRVLAHPYQAQPLASLPRTPTRIAVGPEGGFTDDEVALAIRHGWHTVSLGPRILRIETAAIVLAAQSV